MGSCGPYPRAAGVKLVSVRGFKGCCERFRLYFRANGSRPNRGRLRMGVVTSFKLQWRNGVVVTSFKKCKVFFFG